MYYIFGVYMAISKNIIILILAVIVVAIVIFYMNSQGSVNTSAVPIIAWACAVLGLFKSDSIVLQFM